MIIGFDYWQVISHYPEQMGMLRVAIETCIGDFHVISAIGKNRVGTVADEIQKLHGWEKFPKTSVHEVVFKSPKDSPELKLSKCKELGIEMFFDDRDDVCKLLNKNGILAMRVTRKDNSTYDLEAEQK